MAKNETKRDEWAKRIEQWAASGLTSEQFAAQEGINARTLAHWKWRLGKEARKRASRPRSSRPAGDKRETAPAPTFVELAPSAVLVAGEPIEIVTTGGEVVRVPVGFDDETLTRVLAVLEARR